MTQSELEALLGRPLTSAEAENKDLYLGIAKESLEGLLCITLHNKSEQRTFTGRGGYRTLFTDVFHEISEVKLNGIAVNGTDYYAAQWDKRSADWYNSIIFSGQLDADCEVEVTADWGFRDVPSDVKRLWAQLFANISKKYTASGKIQSKWVEDFRITFATDVTTDGLFIAENRRTIEKYSMCNVGAVRHGRV